jgi:glycyl-tRNA synthetase
MNVYEQVIELAKRRGFFWPSYSIYGGESGFYDYGPLGVLLKDNVIRTWKEAYVSEGGIMIDTPVIVPESVFRTSGHIEKFSDLATECPKCHNREKLETVMKASGNENVINDENQANEFLAANTVKCVKCGTRITKAFESKQMFKIPDQVNSGNLYLRPETAQGIFVNFKLLNTVFRGKLPMAVAQLGKGFRNEISPRQGLLRMKELNMGEVEVFVIPDKKYWKELIAGDEIKLVPKTGPEVSSDVRSAFEKGIISSNAMAYFINKTYDILKNVGIKHENIRFRQQHDDELAHYSVDTWDAEALLDDSWVEVVGIADRNDLRKHQDATGESVSVKVDDADVIPSIIEPAYGIDRMVMSLLMNSFYTRENGFKVLRIPEKIAPYHAAVLPLVNKDGLDLLAKELHEKLLLNDPYVYFDQSGSIGKRYARQDEIGTPYCITLDHDSATEKTVTVRERDSTKQTRISMDSLIEYGIIGNPEIRKFRETLQ